jgi:hypothetical protein
VSQPDVLQFVVAIQNMSPVKLPATHDYFPGNTSDVKAKISAPGCLQSNHNCLNIDSKVPEKIRLQLSPRSKEDALIAGICLL